MADSQAGGRAHADASRPRRSRRKRARRHLVNNVVTYAVWSTYLGAGIAVATSNRYLDFDRAAVPPVVAGVLAVALWPLVFLGANVRL